MKKKLQRVLFLLVSAFYSQTAFAQPANDDPCNATPLPVAANCNFVTYNSTGATNTAGVPGPGCGGYSGQDVWFTAIVPPTGSIMIDAKQGTMTDGSMAVYTGTCGNLTLLTCDDDNSNNGLMPLVNPSGLTPGTVVYIRFWEYLGGTGTFQLCATDGPSPTNQDCPNAIPICQNSYSTAVSYSGTGAILNEIDAGSSCLAAGERNDVWYTFTVQNSGDLSFIINPVTNTDDYDFAVYNLTNATCADIATDPSLEVSCNFSATAGNTGPNGNTNLNSQDALGTRFNDVIPVTAGQTYMVNVSNYSSSADGYAIDFSGSTASLIDAIAPQLQVLASNVACNSNTVSFTFSENILCSSIQATDFTLTGPGGPYAVTGWSSTGCASGSLYDRTVTITVNPAMTATGNYSVCLTNVSGSVTDLCGNVAPPACLAFQLTAITANAAHVDVTCFNGTNGSITINANGGTAPLKYSINNGASFQAGGNFAGLAAGNYPVVVEDASGCQWITNVVIAQPPAITISSVGTVDASCGTANGSMNIAASGGTGTLQYSITGGAPFVAGNVFSNLTASNYTVVVRDANGCTTTTNVAINNAAAPVINSAPVVDVTCNGLNNGSITINASGGTGALQYSINNGTSFQAGNVFNGLAAGNYTIVVRDASGCGANTAVVIVSPPVLTIDNTPTTNVACNGGNNGSIQIDASGGTPNIQYSINNGTTYQAGNFFPSLTAGNYTVVVKDANGCTKSAAVNITQPTVVVINSVTPTDVTCNGAGNGLVQITASGGTPAYEYSIDNGVNFQLASSFNGLAPANYQVVVQDANGCTVSGATVIAQPTPVVISSSPVTDVTCNGAADGNITINASGGTGVLQYSNDNGVTFQAGNVFSNLGPGNYQLVVQDANGCSTNASVTIVEPTLVQIISTPVVDVICNGGNTGSITVNASGGTGGLQYSITGGAPYQAGNAFNNLSQGNYNVVVIDTKGCSATAPVTITEPTPIQITSTPDVDVDCNAANNGSVVINANGGTGALEYSIDNGGTFQASNSFSNLAPATYDVVVRDANGCTATAQITITEPTPVQITSTPDVDVDCNGANNGSVVINANGGTGALQYSINNGSTYQAANSFSNLSPATYDVVVRDANGCTATTQFTITEPTPVQITSTPDVDVDCNGANNGSVVINANGGTGALQYSSDNGGTYQASNSFSNLSPATYDVVVRDANGCTATTQFTISEPTPVQITSTPDVDVDCNGANNGSVVINASGGTGALEYSIDNGATYQVSNSFSNLSPATYDVVVRDANGCTATTQFTITEPTPVQITSTPDVDVDCNGANNGSVIINASGGTGALEYSIDNGATYQVSNSFSNLSPATYNVVVRDANGCTATTQFTITEPTPVQIISTPDVDVDCNGANNGSVVINASGGTGALEYSIDNGATYQASNSFSNLSPATYDVVVRDANGCTATAQFTITEPTPVVITGTPVVNVACNGDNTGSITVNANGGTGALQYSITGGAPYQAGNVFNGLTQGNYTVAVIDANGCSVSTPVQVTEPTPVQITSTPYVDVDCNGANNGSAVINANGGTGTLEFSIDNGVTFQASNSFANLSPGKYDVIVRDANGCTSTAQFTIVEPTLVQIMTTPDVDVDCKGAANGSVLINATGGTGALQYSIDNGVTFQPSNSFSSLTPATYNVVVKDVNGCTATTQFTITEPTPVQITSTPDVDVDCNGADNGSVVINASGGTGTLEYSIDNGSTFQASSSFSNLSPATYDVVVRDANGCTAAAQFIVTEPTPVQIISTPDVDVDCNGADNGSVAINANGGTGALQYSIDNGATYQASNSFSNLSPATYDVIVKDANGCTTTAQFVITEPTAIVANANVTNSTCGNSDGTLSVVANGGTGVLQYSNNNGTSFQASANFSGLTAGNYDVVVKDASGCTVTFVAIINNDAAPVITNVAITDIDCYAAGNGAIVITANGGTGALQYSIDNGSSYQPAGSFNALAPGNYDVVVQDANGCTATNVGVINEPTQIVANAVPASSTCSQSNGSLVINANGGTGTLQYSFNNGTTYQAGNSLNNVSAGAYQVVVKDANGCTAALAANINDQPSPTISNVATVDLTCNGSGDGSITITSAGGTGAITYSIDNGVTYVASNSFNNLSQGNYSIIMQDVNGCTATDNAALSQPQAIAANAVTANANCNQSDGSISVNANGGTGALQYSLDGVLFQASANFTGIAAGNYTVTVKDANGCSTTFATVVNSNLAPVINSVTPTDITCNGLTNGIININSSGGNGALVYSSDNGVTYQASSNFNNLSAGTYDVVVKDANGCTVASQAIIVEPTAIAANSVPVGTTCSLSNGSIQINANGGTGVLQYSFDNGTTYQASSQLSNIAAGTYDIVVKDANGCTLDLAVNVVDAPSPVISSTPVVNISCNGADDGHISVLVNGGTGALQYSIDNGATNQPSNQFASLSPGNYTILVTDVSGCTATSNAVVNQPAVININSNSVNANCNQNDGSVVINANGGTGTLQYSIDNGVSYQSSGTFNFLGAGNYDVLVQDANGCTNTVNVAVVSSTAPAITAVAPGDITCYGAGNGSVVITANGGTGTLNYSIDNGLNFQASNSFANLSAGIYAVVVQDANGCTVTQPAQIAEPSLLTANAVALPSTCGISNGVINISSNGGTLPLQFSIDNGATSQLTDSFPTLASGNYDIVVTDDNGCTATDNIVVGNQPSPIISAVNPIDLTCNAAGNGSIAIAVTGGTGTINYSIDNGVTYQINPLFDSLSAGAYTVLVTDANNCTATQNVQLVEPSGIALAAAIDDAICNAPNGAITINANGGNGTLQYSIDNGLNYQSSNVFNNLSAGNYTVVVSDANGCTNSSPYAVANTAVPYISALNTVNPDCNGSLNGSIDITISGSTGVLDYSINNGITTQTTGNFPNLPAGVYSILIVQANGCSTDSIITLTEPASITVNTVSIDATCGNADGSVTINAAGGAGGLMYSMNGGTSYLPVSVYNALNAGNYNVVVQDVNGCTAAATASVSNTNAPVISNVTATDINCFGAGNGSIAITAAGGTGVTQYSINNGVTFGAASSYNNLTAGNYNIVIKDALGCVATSSAIIVEPSAVLFNTVIVDEACLQANGTITVNAIGGTGILNYSNDNGTSFQIGSLFSSLSAGNYTVIVQDANGCSKSSLATVANIAGPSISSINPTDVLCHNDGNGILLVNANGGTGALQFSINNGVNYQPGNLFNNLTAGNYTVIISDVNGCTATSASLINNPTALTVNTSTTAATCSQANGTTLINAIGGTGALSYSINNGLTYNPASAFTGLAPGPYSLVVKDANGCLVNANISITDLPAPVISNAVVTDITCYNAANGSSLIAASGGNGALQYSINNGTNYQPSNLFGNLTQGNYHVIVQDTNMCSDTVQFYINQPAQLNFTLAAIPSTCGNANGIIAVNNPSGGTGVYKFSNDNGSTFQFADSFPNLSAGQYQVQLIDGNGCTLSGAVNIPNLAGPVLDSLNTSDVLCHSGSTGELFVYINGGSGPFDFSIDNGATTQNGNLFNNLLAGNYNVLVTDVNGCTVASPASVSEPVALTVNIASAIATCGASNGSIVLNAQGGIGTYQYSINNGSTVQQNNSFQNIGAGNYDVWVSDDNGCTSAQPLVIVNAPPPVLSLNTTTDVLCFGQATGSALVSSIGGTAPVNYTIDNGTTYQSSPQFNALIQGNYIAIAVDSNGCSDTVTFVVNEPTALLANTHSHAASCYGVSNGSASVATSGGVSPYTFAWSNSLGTNDTIINIASGNYSITVTDDNGCTLNTTVNVNQPLALAVQLHMQNALCFNDSNGSATLNVQGGTAPYTYLWSHAGLGSNVAPNMSAGNYSVLITDDHGCTFTQPMTVTQPQQMMLSSVVNDVKCFGGNDGVITISSSGGTGTFGYVWSVSQNGSVASNLVAGTYVTTATDSNGCTTSLTDSVLQPALIVISDTVSNILCNGQTNGTMSVQVTGGVQPYAYVWSTGSSATGSSISNLAQGTYTVTVTDGNSCVKTKQATIQQPTAINLNVSPDPTICIGQQASLTASASGGVGPYAFKWNTGYVGVTLTVAPAITTPYDVYVTDNNGCNTPRRYANVNVNPALAALMTSGDTLCKGESTTLSATPSGGNGGPYTLTWSGVTSSAASITITPDSTTTYLITVNDGCTVQPAFSQATVIVNQLPNVVFDPLVREGCMPLSVPFSNTSQNAIAFEWIYGDGEKDSATASTHVYTQPGTYDVTLYAVSSEGCENSYTMDNAITVYDLPIAAFDINRTETNILDPRFEFRDLSVNTTQWNWSFGDNKGTSREINPEYAYADTGYYNITLIASSNENCVDTAYGEVHVNGAFTLYIPNAFTPNHDGINDGFSCSGIGFEELQMIIFDRWGNLIFNETSTNPTWPGFNMLNNTDCPQGTYVYKIKVKNIFQEDSAYTGTVTLIR